MSGSTAMFTAPLHCRTNRGHIVNTSVSTPEQSIACVFGAAQVFTSLYNTDDNCFVCAPTGSGKTICAEFALLRLLAKEQQQRAAGEGGGSHFGDGKPLVHAVYVAPLESLVAEKYAEWKEKLEKGLGIKVARLTGQWGTQRATGGTAVLQHVLALSFPCDCTTTTPWFSCSSSFLYHKRVKQSQSDVRY